MSTSRKTDRQVRFIAYPETFEQKVGFDKVRAIISAHTESSMGAGNVASLRPTASRELILRRLKAVGEMMEFLSGGNRFPSLRFADLSEDLKALEAQGSYLPAERLPQFLLFLKAAEALRVFFSGKEGEKTIEAEERFPTLKSFLLPGIEGLSTLLSHVEKILDRFGGISDRASQHLADIRGEMQRVERQSGQIARRVLAEAVRQGWSESDALPTIRDGHTVIPLIPSCKRMIQGVVYDESATGKTIFIEPLEVIENGNRLCELHAEESREIIRILVEFSEQVRPHCGLLLSLYRMVGILDGIKAIAIFALEEKSTIPHLSKTSVIAWRKARHPILRRTLLEQEREVEPLDILLCSPAKRLLVISGPNAGGKSVCLKTVAALQYMLQCGIPIPVEADSEASIFRTIAINIGDDQSIEDDLSTYSSHLRAMAAFCRLASPHSLLMVDEFGAGTEPELGGAIAEALLERFNEKKAFGVITTHYRNLKQFASRTEGVINGAMLYDRGAMQPLFKLSVGQPGSSFAMQIAKRSGIPEDVLSVAEKRVGADVIDSDSYVQDIHRDKSYWQRKREEVRRQSNKLTEGIAMYEEKLLALSEERKKILASAQFEAQTMLKESNALIERTIREIKESAAAREQTLQARKRLERYRVSLGEKAPEEENDGAFLRRELQHTRHAQKKREQRKTKEPENVPQKQAISSDQLPAVGDRVRILPEGVIATVVEVRDKEALLALGNSLSTMKPLKVLERIQGPPPRKKPTEEHMSSNVTDHIHEKKVLFSEELDVRGMRAIDALQQVDYFIDEATQVGSVKVKILHGTGSGALRQSIRQWLAASSLVKRFEDEDVRFGGAGITVVYL